MANSIDVDINVNVSDEELDTLTKKLKEVKDESGEKIDVDVDVDDTNVKNTKKEIDDIKSEKVDVDVDVDDSQIKNAKKEIEDLQKSASANMSATGNAINGLVAGIAGKSIWDTVYGTSAKAETNKVLIKNMGDTSKAYTDLYNTIDKTTDSSLISMQQLIPAMNGIKSATGATASEIDNITPGVASFGQYVYAMTGSSAKAEQAMFDLSKGIKGAYASLDQYGITEDALMRTGLWSGKEDDVEGYIAAVNQVTGSTDELMGTATGMEALLGKSFSRAGKNLGQSVLPAVKSILGGFNQLDAATNGWLSTASLVGGGVASSLVSGLSAINQAQMGYDGLKGSISSVRNAITGENGAISKLKSGYNGLKGAIGTAKTAIDAMRNAESITSGIRAALAVVTGGEAAAETAGAAAKTAATGPTVGLAIAENSLLLPILLVTAAIIGIIAVLWYLYNTNESVRNTIDWLKEAFVNAGQIMYTSIVSAVEWITQALQGLWDYIMTVGGLFPAQASLTGNGIIDAILKVLMFLTSLPVQLGMIFVNMIAQALGFGNNFSQRMIQAAARAIPGFIARLALLPGQAYAILMMVISRVAAWGSQLIARGVAAATGFVNGVRSAIAGVVGAISSALSGVVSAITRPFEQAYAKVKPIIDAIKSGISTVTGFFGASYYGVDFGGEGLSSDSTLNNTLSAGVTNNSNTRNANINNNFYGLVEESAAEYIINTVNERLRKENMVRGV